MGNGNTGKDILADRRAQLESVIKIAIDSAMKEVHTCLPAVVTKVNHAEQLIDAQITIKRKLAGKLVELPLLTNVPIRYPRSKTFSFTFPIEVGDHVELRFCERSIDTWLIDGGIQNPFDIRKHSLSDAFATPAMYHQKDIIPDFDPTNLEIKTNSGDTKIIVKASENVEIITTGEIKAICQTLLANVVDSVTINCDSMIASVNDSITATCDTADITADTSVDITSPITTITGDLTVTGTINSPTMKASSSLQVKGKEMDDHKHPQGQDSNGDTQVNTGGPA